MASIKYINVGTTANDNTGTTLRAGGQLLNNNFSVLLDSLGDGVNLTVNTASYPSNSYLQGAFLTQVSAVATYSTNTVTFATFAQNTATIALINDRMQVSNTNLLVNDRMQVANAISGAALANTNTAIADRVQVANSAAFAKVATSATPNYGAAVTYVVTANGTAGYVVSNMGFDKIGNNPTLTVRNQTTVAFDLSNLSASHPFQIQSSVGNYSNTLIHVAADGTITTGALAQNKYDGVLYWQIPHDISGTGSAYKYQCSSHAGMNGNVVIKDTGSMS